MKSMKIEADDYTIHVTKDRAVITITSPNVTAELSSAVEALVAEGRGQGTKPPARLIQLADALTIAAKAHGAPL